MNKHKAVKSAKRYTCRNTDNRQNKCQNKCRKVKEKKSDDMIFYKIKFFVKSKNQN